MWTVCITSISHVLKLKGNGGLQAKVNENRLCFKGWETLVFLYLSQKFCVQKLNLINNNYKSKRLKYEIS